MQKKPKYYKYAILILSCLMLFAVAALMVLIHTGTQIDIDQDGQHDIICNCGYCTDNE